MRPISPNLVIDHAFHLLPTARDRDGFYIGGYTGMKGSATRGAYLFTMSGDSIYPSLLFTGEDHEISIHSTSDGFKVIGFDAHEKRHGGYAVFEKVMRNFIRSMETDLKIGAFAPTQIYYMERLVYAIIKGRGYIKAKGKVSRGFVVLARRLNGYNSNTYLISDKDGSGIKVGDNWKYGFGHTHKEYLPRLDGNMLYPVPFRLDT